MSLQLDTGQSAAVEVIVGQRQIVLAGPGSGKTEVVAALVAHLIDDEGADEADGLLVISFSNAAVFAVDARLRESGMGPVTVQTMDSLASDVIRDLSDADADGLGFDDRIALAARLLADEEWGRLKSLEHLIVDEVQDVVGVRADFLLQILRSLPDGAGFSLLGDPAQGIYDFQLRQGRAGRLPTSTTTSQQLIDQTSLLEGVEVKRLAGQYRALSRDAHAAAGLRTSALTGGDPSPLEAFAGSIVRAGSVTDVAAIADRWGGRTAFLTGNNGQAMLVAEALTDSGRQVELRRSAQQRVLTSWIALLLADLPGQTVSRAEFDRLVDERCSHLDSANLWRALRHVSGARGSELDAAKLARRLNSRRPMPPELLDRPGAPLVVSTVHRAKGLEFDNVVLVDFPAKTWLDIDEHPEDKTRQRFVAVTRARRLLARSDGPDDRSLRKPSMAGSERWIIGGPKKWMTHGFELRVDDFDRNGPPASGSPKAQERLQSRAKPGDPIEFRLDPDRSSLRLPVYVVLHDGVEVAQTGQVFGEALAARLGTAEKRKVGWPRMHGARIESVATVAGNPQRGDVGRHGLWLAPVAAGLLHIDWK